MVSLKKKKVSGKEDSKTRHEKTEAMVRYLTAVFIVFCITTFYQRSIVIDAVDVNGDTFAGDTVRCAIAAGDNMYSKDLTTGFNYELLKEFAKTDNCELSIVTAQGNADYVDSLLNGAVDIVVLPQCDTSIAGITVSMPVEGNVWAVRSGKFSHIREINLWISHFSSSDEYDGLKDRFFESYDPHRKSERGIRTRNISPYDDLIKKYASEMGWDWRMLAAVIYQESRFSINTRSSRGATGLMQVMPSTAEHYEVMDLLDPEQNIKAGTAHLKRLQRMFRGSDISSEEQIKFVFAAYNAGEGRIEDCRKFAAMQNLDSTRWEEIVKAIPEMSDEDLLDSAGLKFGKFNGSETISYVDNVMDHYRAFCEICPA